MDNFLKSLQTLLTTFLTRWLLKIAGTFFVTIGFESGKVEEIVGGLVAIVIGMVVSWISHKKALETEVKKTEVTK